MSEISSRVVPSTTNNNNDTLAPSAIADAPSDHDAFHEEDDEGAVDAARDNRAMNSLRRWCYCCRNCTGVFLVLGIVNAATILSLGFVVEVLFRGLEESSGVRCRDCRGYEDWDVCQDCNNSWVDWELVAYAVVQLVATAANLATVYCLCRRYNASSRDYKAMVHVFVRCCETHRHPEAIRPLKDVVARILVGCCCGIRSLAAVVGLWVVGVFVVVGATHDNSVLGLDRPAPRFGSVEFLLVGSGVVACVLWMLVARWVLRGGCRFRLPDEEAEEAETSGSAADGETSSGIELV